MEVFINNQSVSFDGPFTLDALLLQQNLHDRKGIAVALNNVVIPKAQWETCKIDAADKITIIRATQGG
jgi:sulfur carrier protein